MTTTLLTGYEPFDDYTTNPSQRIAERLDGETISGAEVIGEVLPVQFEHTNDLLYDLIDEHDPGIVISLGLAPGRAAINIERIGININSATGVPDNTGTKPVNERIASTGPDAHFATLPVPEIVQDLTDAGIPARVSNTAGTHLCNNALYSVREYAKRNSLNIDSGFVHLPHSPELAVESSTEPTSGGSVPASMALEMQTDAVHRSLSLTVDHH